MCYSSEIFLKNQNGKIMLQPVEANDITHQAQFVTPHGENKSFPSIKRHHEHFQFFHGK